MKQVLKGITLYIIVLLILIILQAIVIRIPNKAIKNNLENSLDYYDINNNVTFVLNDKEELYQKNYYLYTSLLIDNRADITTLNIMWNANNANNLYKSQIAMNYLSGHYYAQSLKMTVLNNIPGDKNYARYWHGSIIYLKPLFMLFNVKGIKTVNYIITLGLLIYLGILLFRKSKILFSSYFLSLMVINFIIVPYCFEYFFVFLISIIASIISLKIYHKDDKYFYYLMIITGLSSCFFDFLTCETITLTIPLLITVYLKYKENKKENIFKFIVKASLIWFLAYTFTFLIKWGLSIIVLGKEQINDIWQFASNRIYQEGALHPLKIIGRSLKFMASLLFPFSLFNKNSFLVSIMFCCIVVLIYFIFLEKEQKKYMGLLILISLISVSRLVILFAHSSDHPFFDYRAYGPFIMSLLIILLEGVGNEINYFNPVSKRRKNNRKSN